MNMQENHSNTAVCLDDLDVPVRQSYFRMSDQKTPETPTNPNPLEPTDPSPSSSPSTNPNPPPKLSPVPESAPTDRSPPPKLSPMPESGPTDPSPPPLQVLPADVEPTVGQVLVGRYRLIKLLGSGGMGVVFEARDEELGLDVALKHLSVEVCRDRAAVDRFRKEVSLVRHIRHEGVCQVYEYREDGPLPFFTMELIDGRPLRRVLREDEPRAADLHRLLLQIAKALEAVHEKNVVHRDLKPENVLVRRSNGHAVLVDFGLAKRSLVQGTSTTNIVGTPRYMSPEQLAGEQLDVRTDVFSFGVMAFELLSGEPPFGMGSGMQIVTAIMRDPPVEFTCSGVSSEIERSLQSFFAVALAKKPADRFASATEMRVAFEEAWSGRHVARISSELPPPVKIPTAPVPKEYRKRSWLPAVLLMVAIVAAVVWTMKPPPPAVNQLARLDKSLLACDPIKPTVEVLPFENSSGEAEWDSFARSVADSLRGHLRTSPKLRISEGSEYGSCPTRWTVRGSVQKVNSEQVRLSIVVHDATKTALVPPIEEDGAKGETEKVLAKARDILLDDLRRHARFKERDWRAYVGTKNELARKYLFDYYGLVGTNPQPRKEDLEVGKKLVDDALALDPDYVMALVERAYLLAEGIEVEERTQGLKSALSTLENALRVDAGSADALAMHCRVLRGSIEIEGRPTDSAIEKAINACITALRADPDSARLRFAFALLYDGICDDERAIESLEQIPNEDRALAGPALDQLTGLALQSDRLTLADRASRELLEFEASTRNGNRRNRGTHLLRGAVLLRLAAADKELSNKARAEFEHEMEYAKNGLVEKWTEAGAIRGLIRIAKMQGRSVPQEMKQRLDVLERDATRDFAKDPSVAMQIVIAYQWTDPEAAIVWLERMGPPIEFRDVLRRAMLYHFAGMNDKARQLLATQSPVQKWEQKCSATVATLIVR